MSNQTNTTEVVVFSDITDKNMVQPQSEDILKLFDFDNNRWNGGIFRYSNISQVSLNQTEQTQIDAANQWLSNEFQREDEIKHFKKKVKNILDNASQVTHGKDNSSIYLPIANELNRLSKTKTEKKILLIYSDLMENTDNLSFYRKQDFSILKFNPNKTQVQLEKSVVISPLSGINVWFIYQPFNTKNDEDFQIVSQFYKKLLEDKGARVTVSANLNL